MMKKEILTDVDVESILNVFNKRYPDLGIKEFNKWLFKWRLINLVSVDNYLKFTSEGKIQKVTPAELLTQFTHNCTYLLRGSLLEYVQWLYKMGLLHEVNCIAFLKHNHLKFDNKERWTHNA